MPKLQKRASPTETTYEEKAVHERVRDEVEIAEHKEAQRTFYHRFRPLILGALAALILGWWISSILLKDTRHRWIVSTLFAWSFILIIAFRFIPNTVVTRPVEAVWEPLVSRPFFKLPYKTRMAMGVLALVGAVLGSAYGFPLQGVRELRLRLSCISRPLAGHHLRRPYHLGHWPVARPDRILPHLEEPECHPMADGHRRPLHPAGHRYVCPQDRRRLLHLYLDCYSRLRLPQSGSDWCLLLFQRRHRGRALVLRQHGERSS
jgi:hypothetical protein